MSIPVLKLLLISSIRAIKFLGVTTILSQSGQSIMRKQKSEHYSKTSYIQTFRLRNRLWRRYGCGTAAMRTWLWGKCGTIENTEGRGTIP